MKFRSPATLLTCLFLVWLATYTAAYFATPIKTAVGTNGISSFTVRYYSSDWQVVAFQPAAMLESACRQHEVQVAYEFRP